MQKTVVFDFDGVIHSFSSGWQGSDLIIPDEPVEGIIDAMKEIRNAGYKIVVVSSRNRTPEGWQAVEEWLEKWKIPYDECTPYKPPAIAYIDDRAIKFEGDPSMLLYKIENMKTWLEPDVNLTIMRLKLNAQRERPALQPVFNDAVTVIENLQSELKECKRKLYFNNDNKED